MDDLDDLENLYVRLGWDGDRCDCSQCRCRRFIDEPNETWCRDCRAGRHWPDGAGQNGAGQDA